MTRSKAERIVELIGRIAESNAVISVAYVHSMEDTVERNRKELQEAKAELVELLMEV